MKRKPRPFFNPDDFKKPGKAITGKLGDYHYTGFSTRSQMVRKQEDRIIAQFMNNMSIDFTTANMYTPELQPDMWMLPKSRLETLRWIRLFYNMDPYIYSIINMHSIYPYSMFSLTCEDEEVQKIYNQITFNRDFNLYEFLLRMSLSKNKFGEAIVMGVPDSITKKIKDKQIQIEKWKRFVLFEPEFIEVRQAFFEEKPRYYLQITEDMKGEMREALSEGIDVDNAESILMNNELLLDAENISSIMNLTDASALRGTSPIQSLMKTMIYQDKVSQLKLSAIDKFRYPIELWKIGNIEHDIRYGEVEMKKFEEYVKQAKQNPPFSLFIPPFIEYQVVGYGSEKGMFDYKEDYDWIRDSIMVGLGVNKNIIMGDGPSMSNVKDVTMMKLFMNYKVDQDTMTSWMRNNFYYPIAEKNSYTNKEGDLDLPEIKWHKQINIDKDETEDFGKMWEDGILSTETRMSMYKGVSKTTEEEKLKQEIGSVFDDGKRIRNRAIKPEPPKPKEGEPSVPEAPISVPKPEEKPPAEAPPAEKPAEELK